MQLRHIMRQELRSTAESSSLAETEKWLAFGAGSVLLIGAARARSFTSLWLAAASAPLLYRSFTGRWPEFLGPYLPTSDTRIALGGDRGIHLHESVVVKRPVAEVFRFWRRLENLPQFMTHLKSVTQTTEKQSHWVAVGPGGLPVEWDAEIIHEVLDKTIGWKSLDGADVVSAGSVNFASGPDDRSTTVTVRLQYAPPAGQAGEVVASLLGVAPSELLREDLKRLKSALEKASAAGN
jgi:uncharacterized membrane protein